MDLKLQQGLEQRWLLINLDIDDFRSLNEAFGRELGDRILCWVANSLSADLPPLASSFHLDSDEFLVVLPIDRSGVVDVQGWVAKLQRMVSQAVGDQGSSVPRISMSAGCAIAGEGSDLGALAWMQQANTALQQAKESGRGGIRLYSSAVSALIQERVALERQLERALAAENSNQSFRLLYQPQVNRFSRVVGAEALLRFRGEDGHEIPPDIFIPLAEHTGQIHRLSSWVMETAVRQQMLWSDQGLTPVPLSLNFSARQLDDVPGIPPLLDQLRENLERYNLESKHFVVELTETALLRNDQHIQRQLHGLAAAGFQISLDDFGTGYSSLAVLRDYPVSQVKIDKGFVKNVSLDPRSSAIIEALVGISQAQRMDLVAEGVETTEQWDVLLHLGLKLFQGYLFAPGMTADDFAELLKDPDRCGHRGGPEIAG